MCAHLSDFKPKYVLRSLLSTRKAASHGWTRVRCPPRSTTNPSRATASSSSITAPIHRCITNVFARTQRSLYLSLKSFGTSMAGTKPTNPQARGSAPSKLRHETDTGTTVLVLTPLSPPSRLTPKRPTRAGKVVQLYEYCYSCTTIVVQPWLYHYGCTTIVVLP